ncbi:MAG TPA: carboxypeptidase regulatory-like domain-containing protein [Vicinamibacterales bacterium]|nr:carboxypeptidase regulatory-like domain-containing protein [Vicinamibacterales bacterium]
MRHSFRSAIAALAVIAVAAPAAAQIGRIGGTVKDDTGQPIKGATVMAENETAAPNSLTATTDDKGRFSMIGLKAGPWTFTAQAPGFDPQKTDAMPVRTVGAPNPAIEFKLKRSVTAPVSALGSLAAKDLQAELASADALYNAQRWDDSIAAYRTIMAKAPALSVINLQIAAAYRNKKDYDKAISAYNDLLKTDPSNDKARVGIGMTNLEKGDLAAAEDTLTKAAEGQSPTRQVFYDLGEVKAARGQADAAARWYQKAMDFDPSWGKPILKLAIVQANKGDKDTALKLAEKVIAVDPTSTEAAAAKALIDRLKQ